MERITGLLRRLLSPPKIRFPFIRTSVPKLSMPPPGSAVGADTRGLGEERRPEVPVRVTCVDYSPERAEVQKVTDLEDFLACHRPSWSRVRWINIDGLSQIELVKAFAEKYQLHPLAVEDVLHTVQRPKAEDYPGSGDQPGRLFVVVRMIELAGGQLHGEQVSLFLGRSTLVTFQESRGDLLEPIRQRIQIRASRIRENDVSFLFYALVDAIVDNYFPLLERYSDRLEDVEEEILTHADRETLQEVHAIKRELLLLRRAAWPMRELLSQLQREKHECLSETAQTYLRDVYDHCVQIIDLVETYREITGALTETYISTVSNRTNEIMKVLTVMGTIFIPLTFLAGVYGMNMWIPEARWSGTYFAFWGLCLAIAAGMLLWFRRRGWL
jgi:magnesium transporter